MLDIECLITKKINDRNSDLLGCYYSKTINCKDLVNKIAIEDNDGEIIFCFYCLNHDNSFSYYHNKVIDTILIDNIDINKIQKLLDKVKKYLMLK